MPEEINLDTGHHPCRRSGWCTCICGHTHNFKTDWYRPDIPFSELRQRYGMKSDRACYERARKLGLAKRNGRMSKDFRKLDNGRWVEGGPGGVKRWEKFG